MTANFGRSAYELAFQVSPIILTGGSAAGILGGALPIIGLVGQLAGFAQGFLSSGSLSIDDFFAQYVVQPGGMLINNSVGMYPFANQQVAANAIIEQPLNVSLKMIAPVKTSGGYLTKLAMFTAMRTALRQHNNSGGTYAIATPAFVYTDCLMTGITDMTGTDRKQQQIEWQIDFTKPLITRQDASAAYSGLMGKIAGGQQVSGAPAWSGADEATGAQVPGAMSLTSGATGMTGGITQSTITSGPIQ